jgi:hypothetical protein
MRHITNTQDGTAVQVEAYPGQARLVAITTIDKSRARKGEVFHTSLLTPAEVGALIASLQMCGEHVENWDRDNAAERAAA